MDDGVTVVEQDGASGKAIDSAPEALTTYEIEIPEAASQGEAIEIMQAVYSRDRLTSTWGQIKSF